MKAKAKINIFLKILGLDSRKYHLLSSRFVLINDLFDELILINDKNKEGFELISNVNFDDNIIFKAYDLLASLGHKESLKEFFKDKSLKLIKNIPHCAGLGGGSSDCAAFLIMMNEELNLKYTKEDLITLSIKLGSDIAFFISGFNSANVSGCGEILKEFNDEKIDLSLIMPNIKCQTQAVYKEFDKKNIDFSENLKIAKKLEQINSKELLLEKNTLLNDLFKPCVDLYPKMKKYLDENFFMSGSGSTIFKAKK
ncbi:4-(cytidine 5'-diphospho)-2-C-methyl-D-erythritol kinase [Campylobacter sp. LR291e]|uniref:4-(cytidine 5'-diphospho)-2-C-methyl-D-erythritol kinase n=1 Tax=Campylobacter sp. LR291e TaxID=2593546 RepID=UPI00123ADD51|nr:4-(cytidine 5'-diphospho)-2-C-methyl-D-erythritol kinase [Campylobacter sp. LR291e]KAA6230699.1 4-(cytidine 5'-diphospho)-2-C-methyl-D-erythritol kinase [Campylobacter sp. LR291e]